MFLHFAVNEIDTYKIINCISVKYTLLCDKLIAVIEKRADRNEDTRDEIRGVLLFSQ